MIVLYSTGCPKCKVLERKLKAAGVEFEISNDVDSMIKKGFSSAPVLEVDGQTMLFKDANNWVNDRSKVHEN